MPTEERFGQPLTGWAVAVLAAFAVAAIALTFKPVVEGDGIGYFSYLHSVWVDHDLNLADEYRAAFDAHVTVNAEHLTTRTATGLLADFFPAGPALLASPFYLLALAFHPDGRPLFGPPFTIAFALASLFYGLLALALSYRVARAVGASGRAAVLGTAGVALATPFPYYLLLAPSYSHTFSAFAVGLFVLVWLQGSFRSSALGWFGLGVLGGLMGAVRFQDGPIAALAAFDARSSRWRALWFLPGLVLGFLPQLVVDRVIFGSWLPQRPAGQDLALLPGHYLDVLVSSYHGLFVWSPILLAAVLGAAFCGERRWRIAFGFAFLLEVVLNGAAPDWWGGYAFGARRFLDLTPFFAAGLALAAQRVGPRVAALGVSVLALWNALLVANLTYVQRADRDPGYLGLLQGQWEAVRFLPRVLAQGAAGRDLVWWPVLHGRDLADGLLLLVFFVGFVGIAWRVAQVWAPTRV